VKILEVPVGAGNFSSPLHPDWLWGATQPPIQWTLGALSLG